MADKCIIECWPKEEVQKVHEKLDKVVIYMERLDAVLKFLEASPKYVLTLFKLAGIILGICGAIYGIFHIK